MKQLKNIFRQLNDFLVRADDAIPYRWQVVGVILLSLLAAVAITWLIENISLIRSIQNAIWGMP